MKKFIQIAIDSPAAAGAGTQAKLIAIKSLIVCRAYFVLLLKKMRCINRYFFENSFCNYEYLPYYYETSIAYEVKYRLDHSR